MSKPILQKKDRNVSKRFIKRIKKNFEAKNPMSKSNPEPIRKEKNKKNLTFLKKKTKKNGKLPFLYPKAPDTYKQKKKENVSKRFLLKNKRMFQNL